MPVDNSAAIEAASRLLSAAANGAEDRESKLLQVVELMTQELRNSADDQQARRLRALAYYALGIIEYARADIRANIAFGHDEGDAAFVLGQEGIPYLRELLSRPRLSAFRQSCLLLHLSSLQVDLGCTSDALNTVEAIDLTSGAAKRMFAELVAHVVARAKPSNTT